MTSTMGSRRRSGRATSAVRSPRPAPCSSGRSGSTTTSRSFPRCPTGATSTPATARISRCTRSRTTRRSSTSWRAGVEQPAVPQALIFDLDGTLVDTLYAHIFAWQKALTEEGMPIDGWRIHRRIGMSGGLFTRAVAREVGRELSEEEVEALQKRHGQIFHDLLPERRPLPGAVALLADLRERGVVHGIATSGRRPEINKSLAVLGVEEGLVVIDRGDVARAKPEPDLFLACAAGLGVEPDDCYVVGDAVWDLLAARRARMLSIGLLSGGYGADELLSAGAFRVYDDAAELHASLDELGIDA